MSHLIVCMSQLEGRKNPTRGCLSRINNEIKKKKNDYYLAQQTAYTFTCAENKIIDLVTGKNSFEATCNAGTWDPVSPQNPSCQGKYQIFGNSHNTVSALVPVDHCFKVSCSLVLSSLAGGKKINYLSGLVMNMYTQQCMSFQ